MVDFKAIPIFIISYNRLEYLRRLVDLLMEKGYSNIHIVDNNSVYKPLLDYLDSTSCAVHRMESNLGHKVVWDCGLFDDTLKKNYYVVTDCDILPGKDIPDNFIEYFYGLLRKYRKITKVGFALQIDDLPSHNAQKEKVVAWETKFWKDEIENGIFHSPIDTTFALYRPGVYPNRKKWWESLRVSGIYSAKHLPWYEDTDNPSEETIQYQNSISFDVSDWTHNNDTNVKEKYVRLLETYRAERNKRLELAEELDFIKKYFFRIPKLYRMYLIKRYVNKIQRKFRNV